MEKLKLDNLTPEQLLHIGDLLGYVPAVAKRKAKRFLLGLQNKLNNYSYDENVNYGNMWKVLEIIKYLEKIK